MDKTYSNDSIRQGRFTGLGEAILTEVKEQIKKMFTEDIPESMGLQKAKTVIPETTIPITPSSTPSASQTPTQTAVISTSDDRPASTSRTTSESEAEKSESGQHSYSHSGNEPSSAQNNAKPQPPASRTDLFQTENTSHLSDSSQRYSNQHRDLLPADFRPSPRHHGTFVELKPNQPQTIHSDRPAPVKSAPSKSGSAPRTSGDYLPHIDLNWSPSRATSRHDLHPAETPSFIPEITLPDYHREIPLLKFTSATNPESLINNYLLRNTQVNSEELTALPPENRINIILNKIKVTEELPEAADTMDFLKNLISASRI